MTQTLSAQTRSSSEAALLEMARAQGLELIELELDTGQMVWTWQGGRYPTFLLRRQAVAFMAYRFVYPPPTN